MERKPAKRFEDLIVWQKAHQFVLILSRDLGYGDSKELNHQLPEVSKLLQSYMGKILTSDL